VEIRVYKRLKKGKEMVLLKKTENILQQKREKKQKNSIRAHHGQRKRKNTPKNTKRISKNEH